MWDFLTFACVAKAVLDSENLVTTLHFVNSDKKIVLTRENGECKARIWNGRQHTDTIRGDGGVNEFVTTVWGWHVRDHEDGVTLETAPRIV